MLEYARWKYILVAVVLLLGAAVRAAELLWRGPGAAGRRARTTRRSRATARKQVEAFLSERKIHFEKSYLDGGRLMVRFADVADQLEARDAVNEQFTGTVHHGPVVRPAHAGVPARPGPAPDAAGPGSARRPVPALPGGCERRGRPGAGGLRAGRAARAGERQHPVQGREHDRGGGSDSPMRVRVLLPPEADVECRPQRAHAGLAGSPDQHRESHERPGGHAAS